MAAVDLSTLSFFEGFPPEVLAKVSELGEEVDAEPGGVIIDQGSVGREAFVLVAGEVQVMVSGEPVATIGPGALLGEMALVDLRPRSATVVALTDVDLVSFDAKSFRGILDSMSPEDRARLGEQNSRFRSENTQITDRGRRGRIGG